MTEKGTVKKKKRGIAYVQIARTEKCDGCKACAFGKNGTITMPALCDAKVSVGDVVNVEMPQKQAGAVALLIYALPLILLTVGALIGLVGEWWLQCTLAAAGLALGLICIVPIERRYRKSSGAMPIVTGISEAPDTSASNENQIDGE